MVERLEAYFASRAILATSALKALMPFMAPLV
jgi:hypothetical protein